MDKVIIRPRCKACGKQEQRVNVDFHCDSCYKALEERVRELEAQIQDLLALQKFDSREVSFDAVEIGGAGLADEPAPVHPVIRRRRSRKAK